MKLKVVRTIWVVIALAGLASTRVAAAPSASPEQLLTAAKIFRTIAALHVPCDAEAALATFKKIVPLEFFLGDLPKQGQLFYERQYFEITNLSTATDAYCLEFQFEPTMAGQQSQRIVAVRFCYFSPYGVLYLDRHDPRIAPPTSAHASSRSDRGSTPTLARKAQQAAPAQRP